MTRIIIVRHGHSESNRDGTFTGRIDVPLTEIGKEQARLAGEYVANNFKVDKIYSSPLSRAVDTASYLANKFNLEINFDDRLKEIYGGKWEGLKYDDIALLYPKQHAMWLKDIGHTRCPEGESMGDVTKRATDFLNDILKDNDNTTIAIFTHGGLIKAMQCYMQEIDLYGMQNVAWVPNASISVIDYEKGKFISRFFGYTEHLGDSITNLPKTI